MTEIILEILGAIWFFLPCGLANAVPVIVMKLPVIKKWNYPLDCYKTFRGVRIFGDHKSWRGLISGIILGIIVVGIQSSIYANSDFFKSISWIDYSHVNWIIFGFLAGAGAIMGDAVKSFFKRRMNLKPGATWFPFDQIDYIIGGFVFLLPVVHLVWWRYILIALIYFGLHIVSTVTGYALKLKDSPI